MHKQLSLKQRYLLLAIDAVLLFCVAFAIGNIVADKFDGSSSERQATDMIQAQTVNTTRSTTITQSQSAATDAVQTTTAIPNQTTGKQSTASEIYPTDVIFTEHNGQKCITKIYDQPKDITPETVPKEACEQNGFLYVFLDMTSKDNISEDSKPYQDTITFDSWTNDFNDVFAMTPKQKEITTDDGYSGILELDVSSIRTESNGYTTQSKRYTVTRNYPNLSAADMTYIPKTITENGQTMQLADVKWQSDNVAQLDGHDMSNRYTAIASYSGTKTIRNSNGYIVTASYTGNVSKVTNKTTHYEVMYLGSRIKQAIDWRYPIIAIVVIFLLSIIATLIYWLMMRMKMIEEEEKYEEAIKNENENTTAGEKEQPKIAGSDDASDTRGDERNNANETIPPQPETPAPHRHIYGVDDDDMAVYPGVWQ